ncbi:glycosyltransferase, partial [bacterium]|nr:glycosyltransferase [bacterium]
MDVRIVGHPEPQGAASARNTGLAHASGAFVKFLDADDTLPEGHLTTLIELAKTLPNHHLPF